jgi:nitroreductase
MASSHPVSTTPDLNAADVEWALTQAGRAPSIHNTQPWRFKWDRSRFTLQADTAHGLTVTDPDGRELVLSCGAALFNLRLALRKLGRRSSLTLLPDPTDPRTLAILTVTDALPATAEEQRLAEAIPRRHTHRGSFDDRLISPELAVRLQQAATAEGAELHYIHDPGQRSKIEHLARDAEWTQSANDRVREELAEWTPLPGSPRRDGVPVTAYPAGNPYGATVTNRDFDAGRGIGGLETPTPTPGLLLAILLTPQDLERDWLQAGMSLAAVLTTAAEQWAFAALHSQVIEVAPLRAELRRELATAAYPQLVLQLGHASLAPTTPRRPTSDITARAV